MRFPRIDLAYPESIDTCLAIEIHKECLYNPRWIEGDWSAERVERLQRTQDDLEHDSESYGRERRVGMSRRTIYGRVCHGHSRHAERLHTLQMIRGDAKSDLATLPLPETQSVRARIAANRRAKKKVVRAVRSLTPEQGRAGGEDLTDHMGDTASLSSDFPATSPPSVSTYCGHPAPKLLPEPTETPASSVSIPTPATPQIPATQTPLHELMLLGHLREHEHSAAHLEHEIYNKNLRIASLTASTAQKAKAFLRLRQENAQLIREVHRLKLERVQQDQELIQMRNYIRRRAEDDVEFLAAKAGEAWEWLEGINA